MNNIRPLKGGNIIMNLYFIYTKNHSLLGLIRGRTQKSARIKAIKKWSKRRVSFVKIYKSNPNLIGTITVGER